MQETSNLQETPEAPTLTIDGPSPTLMKIASIDSTSSPPAEPAATTSSHPENKQLLIDELKKTVEKGEPTQLVSAILHELSARIKLDLGPTLATKLLGPQSQEVSAVELINQVLGDPQILWKRFFFVKLRSLAPDQAEIML